MTKTTTGQTIRLGELNLRTRLTVKNLKRLKEITGLDFTSQDTGPMLDFAVDPITVATACYALYLDQFETAKINEEDLEEMLGPSEIAELRKEVTEQMKSFSSFWKILATEMEGLQSGSTSLVEQAAKVQQMGRVPEVSGPSS